MEPEPAGRKKVIGMILAQFLYTDIQLPTDLKLRNCTNPKPFLVVEFKINLHPVNCSAALLYRIPDHLILIKRFEAQPEKLYTMGFCVKYDSIA